MRRTIESKLSRSRLAIFLACPYYAFFSLLVFFVGAAVAFYFAPTPYFGRAGSLPLIPVIWLALLTNPLQIVSGLSHEVPPGVHALTLAAIGILYAAPLVLVFVPSVISLITRRVMSGPFIAMLCLPVAIWSGYLNGTHIAGGMV